MIDKYKIKGSLEFYIIVINSCSEIGDWEFVCNMYDDMKRKGVVFDEVCLGIKFQNCMLLIFLNCLYYLIFILNVYVIIEVFKDENNYGSIFSFIYFYIFL